MLVDMNILISEDIIMNLSRKIAVIDSCENIEISFIIMTKSSNQINHIILFKQCTVISSHSNLVIKILHLDLFCDQDFFFKSNYCQIDTAVYVHIINYVMTEVYVQNDSNVSLIIS